MRSKDKTLIHNILSYIECQFEENGIIPTFREIAQQFHITSGCVSNYIKYMKEVGLIQSNRKSRSLKTANMLKSRNGVSLIPVVGQIACGSPLLAEENIEFTMPLPNELLGSGEYFILKANGESMVDAQINNGDYVVIRKQNYANEGQIIVALINDEATLKRYYLDKINKKIILHPENKDMCDIIVDDISIQGVAVRIIKTVR